MWAVVEARASSALSYEGGMGGALGIGQVEALLSGELRHRWLCLARLHWHRSSSSRWRSIRFAFRACFLTCVWRSCSSLSFCFYSFEASLTSAFLLASSDFACRCANNCSRPSIYALEVRIFDLVKSRSGCWRFCFLVGIISGNARNLLISFLSLSYCSCS